MQENGDAVAHVHEENQVHEEPHEPSDESAHLNACEADDGGTAANGGHAALIPISKGWAFAAGGFGLDAVCDERAHLNRCGRDARDFDAVFVCQCDDVSCREDFGMSGETQVREDFDAASAIQILIRCGLATSSSRQRICRRCRQLGQTPSA